MPEEESELYNPSKHVGRHPETGIPLVRARHKYKKPKSARGKDLKNEGYKPLNPWFCPMKDPDTKEVCGKMMSNWDDMFYNSYGMCQDCAQKYNPHLFGNLKDVPKVEVVGPKEV